MALAAEYPAGVRVSAAIAQELASAGRNQEAANVRVVLLDPLRADGSQATRLDGTPEFSEVFGSQVAEKLKRGFRDPDGAGVLEVKLVPVAENPITKLLDPLLPDGTEPKNAKGVPESSVVFTDQVDEKLKRGFRKPKDA